MGTVLQRVYPWMLLVVFQSVLMWTMIAGLLNRYVFLACLMSFLTNLWSLSIVDWRKEMNQSAEIVLIIGQTYVVGQICAGLGTLAIFIGTQYPRETQGIIFASVVAILAATAVSIKGAIWFKTRYWKDPSFEKQETETRKDLDDTEDERDEHFEVKSSLTSVWLPCVVGSKSHIFVTSVMISQINKLFLLALAILLNYLEMIDPSSWRPRDSENLLRIIILTITILSSLLSAVASYKLAKIVDYFTLFRTSKRLLCMKTDPIVHHSLIFKLCISDDNEELLREVLKNRNTTYTSYLKTIVNMTQQGETPLHISTRFKAVQASLLLMKAGSELKENGDGRLPEILHLALEGNEPEIITQVLKNQHQQPEPPFTISTLMQQKNLEGQTSFQVAAAKRDSNLLGPLLKLALLVVDQEGSLMEETAELLQDLDCVKTFQELKDQQGLKRTTLNAIMSHDTASSLTCLEHAEETKTLDRNLKVLDIFLKHMKPFLNEPANADLCLGLFTIVAEINKENKSKKTMLQAARQSSDLLRALEELQKENQEEERKRE